MTLLDVHDLHLSFRGFDGEAKVLDGVDLALAPGETVGIVGETGCGKSVLAKSIMGLLPSPPARVARGGIRFRDTELTTLDPAGLEALRGPAIAMIFQDPMTYLNPVFTIGQQMGDVIAAHQRRRPRAERLDRRRIRARAAELLGGVGLPDPAALLARYPHQLSGGMRQRVLIAMALSGDPSLLIADEPTTALDVTVQAQVLALVAGLVERLGLALLLISHDLGVIASVCRRVAVMYAGTVVEDADTAALFARPRHPYTRGLLAAIPTLDGGARPAGIPGSIPSMIDPPTGCRFHPRCPLKIERCRTEKPRLRTVADGHRVACHLAEP